MAAGGEAQHEGGCEEEMFQVGYHLLGDFEKLLCICGTKIRKNAIRCAFCGKKHAKRCRYFAFSLKKKYLCPGNRL